MIFDKKRKLESKTFLEKKHNAWLMEEIPFLDCPDQAMENLYYYRWELVHRHLRQAPDTGRYLFTEFDSKEQLYWAGRNNMICCAAMHHISEARWLRNSVYAEDYLQLWLSGEEDIYPNRYSWSAGEAAWKLCSVTGNRDYLCSLLEPLLDQHQRWIAGEVCYPFDNGYDPQWGLFWNSGRNSSGEFNLASCQLSEERKMIAGYKIRGGAGYRPDINADMYADMRAISLIAGLLGKEELSAEYTNKAAQLKENIHKKLWNSSKSFFLHRWRYDEFSEGDDFFHKTIKAGSWIWEGNRGNQGGVGFQPKEQGKMHGRELVGYLPWYYNLVDDSPEYAEAFQFLMDDEYFHAPYGPTTAEKNDPWFSVVQGKCRMNGNSWPLTTSKVITAVINLLNDYTYQGCVTPKTLHNLLREYTATQIKNSVPFVAESHHPYEDSWTVNRKIGRHYFHSTYNDLILSGIIGLRPVLQGPWNINPLVPENWEYFCLEDCRVRGRELTIIWDRTGERYGQGAGFRVLLDGQTVHQSMQLQKIQITLT